MNLKSFRKTRPKVYNSAQCLAFLNVQSQKFTKIPVNIFRIVIYILNSQGENVSVLVIRTVFLPSFTQINMMRARKLPELNK